MVCGFSIQIFKAFGLSFYIVCPDCNTMVCLPGLSFYVLSNQIVIVCFIYLDLQFVYSSLPLVWYLCLPLFVSHQSPNFIYWIYYLFVLQRNICILKTNKEDLNHTTYELPIYCCHYWNRNCLPFRDTWDHPGCFLLGFFLGGDGLVLLNL